jgi:hypothetical protein
MTTRRNRSSWLAGRTRRHAAFSIGNLPPPTPTPVPDDDDEFDWPGSQDVNGLPISSRFASIYAMAEANDCFTVLLGQQDGTVFRDLVTRPVDQPVTQLAARRYDNGGKQRPLVWELNPQLVGTTGMRAFGKYVIDHVYYARVCKETGQAWLADRPAHAPRFNPDPHFFSLLSFELGTRLNVGATGAEGVGKIIAQKESSGGGFDITWKAVKVGLVGATGHGTDGTPLHFGTNTIAAYKGSTAATETYAFPASGLQLKANAAHGGPLRGAFLVGYGLYVRSGGGLPDAEFYAVTPPLNCKHPMQNGDPEAP